jgi:hypothetical protein
MIRIFIDERGSGHDDLILKIDAHPTFSQVADTYYLADFLKVDLDGVENIVSELGISYINYFMQELENIDGEQFVIFDISDEYLGGLLFTQKKKGLLQINYGTTEKIHGYDIHKDCLKQVLFERKPEFDRRGEWLLSYESIVENLNWSIQKIKNQNAVDE